MKLAIVNKTLLLFYPRKRHATNGFVLQCKVRTIIYAYGTKMDFSSSSINVQTDTSILLCEQAEN